VVTSGSPDAADGRSERLFVGVEPALALRRALLALAAGQPEVLFGDWHAQAMEELHLTLRFIGSLPTMVGDGPDRFDIQRELSRLCRGASPCVARFEHIEFWPEHRSRLAVITLQAAPGLLELAEQCSSIGLDYGIPAERRPFRPHITLARGRAMQVSSNPRPGADLPDLAVDHLCLYRARPGHRPRYEVVWRAGLGSTPTA